MSKPRYWWWSAIQSALRLYPELKQRYGTPSTRVTAQYGAKTLKSGTGRALEGAAIERLSDGDCVVYEAISDAVRETARMETGEARLAIINLVYWQQTRTLQGAAQDVGYSYDRAKEFHGEFIRLIAFYMGYLPKQEVRKKKWTKKFTPQSQKSMRK